MNWLDYSKGIEVPEGIKSMVPNRVERWQDNFVDWINKYSVFIVTTMVLATLIAVLVSVI